MAPTRRLFNLQPRSGGTMKNWWLCIEMDPEGANVHSVSVVDFPADGDAVGSAKRFIAVSLEDDNVENALAADIATDNLIVVEIAGQSDSPTWHFIPHSLMTEYHSEQTEEGLRFLTTNPTEP